MLGGGCHWQSDSAGISGVIGGEKFNLITMLPSALFSFFFSFHFFMMSHACLWSDICLTAAGSETGRESVEEGERHPGGERERHPADSAPTGL